VLNVCHAGASILGWLSAADAVLTWSMRYGKVAGQNPGRPRVLNGKRIHRRRPKISMSRRKYLGGVRLQTGPISGWWRRVVAAPPAHGDD